MGRGTPNVFTTWITLGSTPLDVGGLMILEDSHKKTDRLQNYLSRDVDTYCTNSPNAAKLESGEMLFEWDGTLTKNPRSLREKLGGRWLTAEFEPGDLLIFTMRTVHASLDNQSNRIRISTDTRYQLASDPIDERYAVDHVIPYDKRFKNGRIC
jgi:ectoine hydroxylase-related dioxygenase (phytanoyl-CoA dioxygenase family)